MRSFITLLAAGLVLSSAPALAASKSDKQKQTAPEQMAAASTQSPDQKYCIEQNPDESTGSRIYARECHTKADWAKRGVDIDEAQRQQ